MKDFFGLWAFGFVALLATIYMLLLLFGVGVSFIIWDFRPISCVIQQLDWYTFRVCCSISSFIGFFFALFLTSAELDH